MDIEHVFKSDLPENLYLNQYDLAEKYQKYTPTQWRDFLEAHKVFIRKELASIIEARARLSISNMGGSVSEVKELLAKSEMFQSEADGNMRFVFSFIPHNSLKDPEIVQSLDTYTVEDVPSSRSVLDKTKVWNVDDDPENIF